MVLGIFIVHEAHSVRERERERERDGSFGDTV